MGTIVVVAIAFLLLLWVLMTVRRRALRTYLLTTGMETTGMETTGKAVLQWSRAPR